MTKKHTLHGMFKPLTNSRLPQNDHNCLLYNIDIRSLSVETVDPNSDYSMVYDKT